MPLTIIKNDITRMRTDAIVNAANELLAMGGGVCGAIFAAAGVKELTRACEEIGFCSTGEAVITPGFALPAKYIIHAVGPVWQGGRACETDLLASCYYHSLRLAEENAITSIAFPLISAGIYGMPKEIALSVAIMQINRFLERSEMDIYLVLFDRADLSLADECRGRVDAECNKRKEA
jgi:O-acetyl-ADP-ribose deacetylase (regulator of RNase III)